MQEPNQNEVLVDQSSYLETAVPIIRNYLDSHESFTTELLQLTAEHDIETLSKNLGVLAKKVILLMIGWKLFSETKTTY